MLILVRHGETDANAKGLLLGRADPPLSSRGRAQAAALAAALPRPARLVSSPLRRARETAARFAAEATVDQRWVEMDYGDLDQTPVSDVAAEVWAAWRDDVAHVPAGGESLAEVGARVRHACEELAPHARDADVLVVTHVSPMKAAVAWALGVGDAVAWRMYVEDAAVCRIEVTPSGPVLRSFNEHPAGG